MLSSPRSEHRDECGTQHACTLCYSTCKGIKNNVLEDRKCCIIQYTWYDSVIDCSVLHTKRVLKVLRKDDVSIDKIAECVVYQKAVPCSSAVGRTNDSTASSNLANFQGAYLALGFNTTATKSKCGPSLCPFYNKMRTMDSLLWYVSLFYTAHIYCCIFCDTQQNLCT